MKHYWKKGEDLWVGPSWRGPQAGGSRMQPWLQTDAPFVCLAPLPALLRLEPPWPAALPAFSLQLLSRKGSLDPALEGCLETSQLASVFADKEAQAQRVDMTYQRSQSKLPVKPGLEPKPMTPKPVDSMDLLK